MKFQNIWDKEKNLKVSRRDGKTDHSKENGRSDFLTAMPDARRKWSKALQILIESNF